MIPPGLITSILGNKYVIGAVVIVTLCTGAYIYYLRTSSKIERLEHHNQLLQLENDSLKQAIDSLKKDYESINNAKEDLRKEVSDLKKKTDQLEDTLYRENKNKKSLEELAIKKTSLIEKKVNAATDKVLKCFETITSGGDC